MKLELSSQYVALLAIAVFPAVLEAADIAYKGNAYAEYSPTQTDTKCRSHIVAKPFVRYPSEAIMAGQEGLIILKYNLDGSGKAVEYSSGAEYFIGTSSRRTKREMATLALKSLLATEFSSGAVESECVFAVEFRIVDLDSKHAPVPDSSHDFDLDVVATRRRR